jgi:hypothetical protein
MKSFLERTVAFGLSAARGCGFFVAMLAAPAAFAGSVLQPGATIGLAAGAPLREGVYFIDTSSYGQRTNTASGQGINLTALVWATPLYFDDTRLQLIVLQPSVYTLNTDHDELFLNSTLIAGQLAHAFGNGISASYMAGARTGMGSPQAYQLASFEQRFAISYTASGWDLTANLINGDFGSNPRYPDWLNLDLTATKRFDAFEFGAVAFGSTDLNAPLATYKRQRQFAVGGLIGCKLDRMNIQAIVTRDVAEHGYTGYDTRGWIRLSLPFYLGPQIADAAPPSARN